MCHGYVIVCNDPCSPGSRALTTSGNSAADHCVTLCLHKSRKISRTRSATQTKVKKNRKSTCNQTVLTCVRLATVLPRARTMHGPNCHLRMRLNFLSSKTVGTSSSMSAISEELSKRLRLSPPADPKSNDESQTACQKWSASVCVDPLQKLASINFRQTLLLTGRCTAEAKSQR